MKAEGMTTAATTRNVTRRERRRTLRRGRRLLAMATVCLLLGTTSLLAILAIQGGNARREAAEAASHEAAQAEWMPAEQKRVLERARAYNRVLARSSQHAIGSITDQKTGAVDFAAKADKDYWNTLKDPQGVMGTVRIPRIGVALPIRHGSDETALANGAGHLYGTSLPIGGRNTHTVVTAHRGVPDKELFTRLDEMRRGDVFYLTVAGRTIAYKVVRITTTDPSDTSLVRIQQGRDLATLLTCTPYGVNTQRLLVTGERAAIPKEAPRLKDAPRDMKPVWVGVGVGAFVLTVGLIIIPARPTIVGGHLKRRA